MVGLGGGVMVIFGLGLGLGLGLGVRADGGDAKIPHCLSICI